MKVYELVPTNGRKSFYGKAKVVVEKNTETLYSYDTPICVRNNENNTIKKLYYHPLSNTTAAHVKSFCGLTKKEFEAIS